MDWTPLHLSTPTRDHVFGGTLIRDRLGRQGLPPGRIAETWEVSDVDGDIARVVDGPLAGRTLRELTLKHPDELMGRGWRGQRFPLLSKFIDGTGMLPVHLHADDETARRLEDQPNGKTEAWHILDAAPGATALVGLLPGVDRPALRQALLQGDYDRVMRRLPIRAGDTLYVPGGTLHSFGPHTLIYEIEQTSNIQQHAMPWRMEDGSPVPPSEQASNIDKLLDELKPDERPDAQPGLRIAMDDGVDQLVCCAGPYFALSRWRAPKGKAIRYRIETATLLSNVGTAVHLACGGWQGELGPAQTRLLPAVLGDITISGPADVLIGWLPDLQHDIVGPLRSAGYGPEALAAVMAPR